jgi:hypothetical protein
MKLIIKPVGAQVDCPFFRFRYRHPSGARREDQLPVVDLERDRQRDRQAARRGKDLPHHGVVGKEDWSGESKKEEKGLIQMIVFSKKHCLN